MHGNGKKGPKSGTAQALSEFDHRIIATVRDPLIILDGDFRVIFVNDSFYRTFKVFHSETEGRLIFEIGNRQWDIPRLRILLEKILLNDQQFQDYEVEHDFPQVGHRTMLLNAQRLRGGGAKDLILLAIEDVTERKRAEEQIKRLNEDLIAQVKQVEVVNQQLNRTMEELVRSNRDLEEVAYLSSHDLQEPLRKIANFAEMLAHQYQDQLDERAERYFGYITGGAKRLQALISDLLSYSRVGRAEMPLVQANLEDILKGTLNDLQPLIRENGAEISYDPLPILHVNPEQMGRLLQNLIANGIKYHGNQSPRIHLSARQEGKEWVIAVRDNGIGFDPQYAEDIFLVFKRLHAKEQYPGTGIGLAICRKIVDRHGGRIWVESEPGKGSTFYFTIPN